MNELIKIAEHHVKLILKQREEILSAFIAEYGYNPDEVEQVLKQTKHGWIWYVRKRNMQQE